MVNRPSIPALPQRRNTTGGLCVHTFSQGGAAHGSNRPILPHPPTVANGQLKATTPFGYATPWVQQHACNHKTSQGEREHPSKESKSLKS